MSYAASIRTLVLSLALVIVSAAPAHAGTIVFDFEDGLQGWELTGAVQRVQTQLLGGEWAIFGDGLIPGEAAFMMFGPSSVLSLQLPGEGRISSITFDVLVVESRGLAEPRALLGLAIVDATFVDVPLIHWNFLLESQRIRADAIVVELPTLTGGVVAFIDNITFHTIPEPSVLGMLMMGGVAWGMRRARHWGDRRAAKPLQRYSEAVARTVGLARVIWM